MSLQLQLIEHKSTFPRQPEPEESFRPSTPNTSDERHIAEIRVKFGEPGL